VGLMILMSSSFKEACDAGALQSKKLEYSTDHAAMSSRLPPCVTKN
jgi:hypothetical protein